MNEETRVTLEFAAREGLESLLQAIEDSGIIPGFQYLLEIAESVHENELIDDY